MSEEMEVHFEEENIPADAPVAEVEDAPEVEAQGEEGGDTEAPSTNDDGLESVEFTPEQQRFMEKKVLGPKVWALRETERKLQAAESELEKFRSNAPENAAPAIPEMPDPWDDAYEQKMQERDAALLARANYDREQEFTKQQAAAAKQQQQQEFITEFNKKVAGYSAQAKQLGITSEELQIAGEAVKAHQLKDDLVLHLIEHDQGPAITVWLSEHVGVLDEVSRMSPLKAATYIEKNVLPKVGKRRASAPPPARSPRGSGGSNSDPILKGATFG